MNAVESVSLFIQRLVAKEKRDRYVEFVSKEKNREKFLRTLDHALVSEIYTSKAVKSIDEKKWNESGFLYSSDGTFGLELSSLREGYDKASPYGGWLLINQSGDVAIFRPEGKIDDELYFKL